MLVSDFNYDLPPERIAQKPLADRASSKLLHLNRSSGVWTNRQFKEFPSLLRTDDLLVFNNTRVFPARLYGRRAGLKAQAVSDRNPASRDVLRGRIEVLLTRQIAEQANEWECLVRPGRKVAVGETLFFGDADQLHADVIRRGEFGERWIRFSPVKDFFARLDQIGHIPLPPYIDRPDSAADRERYQTVYSQPRGSVAAPTAGLHFTPAVIEEIKVRGVETAEITLHVGLGTFQPVRVEQVEEHKLHSETYVISTEAAEKINRALREKRRVIAVGTTTVRTLEFAASLCNDKEKSGTEKIIAGSGEANIFIYPGYKFQVVHGLLTNFHLPQSTLLMLVCAFAGRENVLRAYRHAVSQEYRFYSYGDCMFIE
ncbi:MAG: tRNA preQ1(34) S-adenosylmethionine ribosyltransferase-isomerase QueA [Candidatus Sulfotelmatobacter sp.]